MKKSLLFAFTTILLIGLNNSFSQTFFYTEDFDGALTWNLNTDLGTEGAGPNIWYISCEEEGVGDGNCGTACGAGNQTLHVSTNVSDLGAAYFEVGDGSTTTDRRAESGDINTTGYTGLSLSFEMIGYGGNADDFCELFYSTDGGGTWTSLDAPLTSLCCGSVMCDGALQGLWETSAYALPASCEGIPDLRISFVWKNLDDGVATDPSFAVDNISISGTAVPCAVNADFSPSRPYACVGECLTFADLSTGPVTGWTWSFSDASIGGPFAGADPGSICFDNVGSVDVTLEVTDGTCTDDTTIAIPVYDLPTVTATAAPNDSVCNGDEVTLNGGGADTYTWDGGVTDGVPFTPPLGSNTYTVTGEDANSCENTADITIVVQDCEPLNAGFSYPDPACIGDCLTLMDTTTGEPSSWSWDFGDAATPNTSTEQNPLVCFDSIGVFDIQLTVMDDFGQSSSVTNQVTVYSSPEVETYSDTIIDLGGEVYLISNDTIDSLSYLWTENYLIDCDTCAVTYATPHYDTSYVITVTDTNGCTASDTVNVVVNFIEGIGVPSAFSPNGDGSNDVLWVKGIGITSMTFSVYNRYGEKVFETQDQSIGWDGTFRGRDENQGVFLWVLEYTLFNGNSGILKGNTTLIR